MRQKVFLHIFLSFLLVAFSSVTYAQNSAILLNIKGAIGPATQEHVEQAFQYAGEKQASLIILKLDTPGGLSSTMREIIQAILQSPIPVVTYVAPSGARAASAGTYILYASHIAAMAPATNLGAATPIQMGTPGTPNEKDENTQQDSAMTKKAMNDARAYLRSLAQLRGRNEAWAEEAVKEGASLSAKEALEKNVIDIVANNTSSLLKQLNHRQVRVLGNSQTLNTDNITIEKFEPSWRIHFLNTLTNPNIAYILMLIGIYGLIFELANPGFVLPGVIGAICLLLALYALHLLPVNYTGLALIILGVAFMIAEAFITGFGILGLGGIIAFAIGSLLLMDTNVPGYTIAWPSILAMTALTGLFFLGVVGMAIRARRRQPITGVEYLLGNTATVEEDFEGTGRVRRGADSWQAHCAQPLKKGQTVKIIHVEGLTVTVEPLENGENSP